MRIPTVESCGFIELRTAGLIIGIFEAFVHVLAMLIQIRLGTFLFIPITLAALTVNIMWIFGIHEKKAIMMLPALIFPIFASLVGIIFITIIPVCMTVATFEMAFVGRTTMNSDESAITLLIWFIGCGVTALVSYITVVQYSVYQSVDYGQRNKSRLQSTCMNEI